MKMQEALRIINTDILEPGFMVAFERVEGGILASDYFPDQVAGEPLIKTEEEAWRLAEEFAARTWGRCVNLYVIKSNYTPVEGYKDRLIVNRTLRSR